MLLGWRNRGFASREPILSLGSERASHTARGSVAKTSYFLEHPLSGGDNGRVLPIEAQSGFGLVENYLRFAA